MRKYKQCPKCERKLQYHKSMTIEFYSHRYSFEEMFTDKSLCTYNERIDSNGNAK